MEHAVPTVLVISPGLPDSVAGRGIGVPGLDIELTDDAEAAVGRERASDLLVLAGMSVDEQQSVARRLQALRRWRLVPVLYVQAAGARGMAIPGTYRPGIDRMVRGDPGSTAVQRQMTALARDGVALAQAVAAGPYELDPIRTSLRIPDGDIPLTERESAIMAILLAHPNCAVRAQEIIERGWGCDPDARYQQILRRHVSNIRRKLASTRARRSLRTVRGSGYLFDIRA